MYFTDDQVIVNQNTGLFNGNMVLVASGLNGYVTSNNFSISISCSSSSTVVSNIANK